jgi:hypothetical protein
MFNAGPARGEAIGAYHDDPHYHAILEAVEYERLLDDAGFGLLEQVVGDVAKGGRVVWVAGGVTDRRRLPRDLGPRGIPPSNIGNEAYPISGASVTRTEPCSRQGS